MYETVDSWTLTVLEQITDLLDAPNPPASCIRRAFALAYAERERLSKHALDRMTEDNESVDLSALSPVLTTDSALLAPGGAT